MNRRLVDQFGRFAVVGVANTAISFVVYAVLVRLDVPYWLAGAIAFVAGAVNGYVFNRRWTFRAQDRMATRMRYLTVVLGAVLVTDLLLWLFVSVASLDRIAAYALALPAVTVATFAGNRAWTFADGAKR